MEIEIATRLFQRHGTPHHLAARGAGGVDAIGLKSHDRTMTGQWRMASRNLSNNLPKSKIPRFSNSRLAFSRQ
jgi:hypothetical protein